MLSGLLGKLAAARSGAKPSAPNAMGRGMMQKPKPTGLGGLASKMMQKPSASNAALGNVQGGGLAGLLQKLAAKKKAAPVQPAAAPIQQSQVENSY